VRRLISESAGTTLRRRYADGEIGGLSQSGSTAFHRRRFDGFAADSEVSGGE
jgi:hypothetical protein